MAGEFPGGDVFLMSLYFVFRVLPYEQSHKEPTCSYVVLKPYPCIGLFVFDGVSRL